MGAFVSRQGKTPLHWLCISTVSGAAGGLERWHFARGLIRVLIIRRPFLLINFVLPVHFDQLLRQLFSRLGWLLLLGSWRRLCCRILRIPAIVVDVHLFIRRVFLIAFLSVGGTLLRLGFRSARLIFYRQDDLLHSCRAVWPSNGDEIILGTGKDRCQYFTFRRRSQRKRHALRDVFSAFKFNSCFIPDRRHYAAQV